MIFKKADKELERLGFIKNSELESDHGVMYFRPFKNGDGNQVIWIFKNKSGNHFMSSIEDGEDFTAVGLTYEEVKAIMHKYREMKRKYGWK